ncbi:Neurofilament triplet L protein, putative [Ectocarpus siliculosus]|uniref:Neurofilament triplet L protein, putative n=1 Tax=Ectocarpus siliculosus TaxID=2880 RepID=D8LHF9_ECTSI|nr:Neurofilament triplet L protein, putative [Ectocarpus siliculosus]|eukprot:CBN79110.1 Neurofilament triplet L protein, putative [Ectocarpus siliculosus]
MLATSDGVSFVAHNNGEQTSGGTVGTYKGRKFVPTKDKPAVAAAEKSKIPKNVNLEDLHQAMEDDSTAVDVLKREVLMAQESEAKESFGQLEMLQRTHDKLRSRADRLEAVHDGLFNKLEVVKKTLLVKKVGTEPERQLARLQVELRATDKRHQDAMITKETTEFIVKRITKVNQRMMLQSESLAGLQQVMEERSVQLFNQEERIHQRDDLLTKSGGAMRSDEEERLARTIVVRNVYSSILQRKVEDEQRHLGALEDSFQQIKNTTGLAGVDDIIERYQMRAGKNQQLHLMAEEIRQRIESLRKENHQQRQWRDDLHRRQEATSGNRDMYQEVDLIDIALGSARKQCDDAKERANRLSVTVDRLRDALSRFMSKVDSKTHPVAPQSKMPEVFAQLDSKITHMMKAVSAALVKDDRGGSGSGAGDSGAASGGGGGGGGGGGVGGSGGGGGDPSSSKDVFSKLDNASVTKILYANIMSTEPDTSPRNVRVTPTKSGDAGIEKRIKMKILLGPEYVSDEEEPDSEEESEGEQEDARDTFVDRTTVKKLANLVLGRDTKTRGTRRRRLRRKDG